MKDNVFTTGSEEVEEEKTKTTTDKKLIWRKNPQPLKYVVDPFIRYGEITGLQAKAGTGKTVLLADIVWSYYNADKWLNHHPMYRKDWYESLYVMVDDQVETLEAYLVMTHDKPEEDKELGYLITKEEMISMKGDYEAFLTRLRYFIDTKGVRFVIIDTLTHFARMFGKDVSDGNIETLLTPLKDIATEKDVAIVYTLHETKRGDERGSGIIRDTEHRHLIYKKMSEGKYKLILDKAKGLDEAHAHLIDSQIEFDEELFEQGITKRKKKATLSHTGIEDTKLKAKDDNNKLSREQREENTIQAILAFIKVNPSSKQSAIIDHVGQLDGVFSPSKVKDVLDDLVHNKTLTRKTIPGRGSPVVYDLF